MRLIETPPVHNPLRLKDLSPKKSPAFSPNLYRWMRAHSRFFQDGGTADQVYRVKPGTRYAEFTGAGTLFIGRPYAQYEGDSDFSGARLTGALCNGAAEQRCCLPGAMQSLEPLEDFWERYLSVGRCAIDPTHSQHFMGDRYSHKGSRRTCLWCGQSQRKIVSPRIVHDERWEAE